MAYERSFDRDRAGQDHDRRDHDRDMYRGRDGGRGGYRGENYRGEARGGPGYYGRAGNIDYGGYPEAALGDGGRGAGYRGGGERSLGYGRGGRIDYGGYPKGALGPDGGREGFGRRSGDEYGRHQGREGNHGGGFGFGGDLEGVGEYRGRGPLGYTRSDERIREDVCDRLTDDPHLDASAIEVQVSNGEVTLSGTIGRRPDKRRAEDIADDISGVKHVQNNLRVQDRGLSGTSGEAAATTRMGQDSTTGATPAAANEPNTKHGRSAA